MISANLPPLLKRFFAENQGREIMAKKSGMFEIKLESVRQLSDSTREFRFVRTDGERLAYKPGQFYRFTFTDEAGDFERSYSLCNYSELYGQHLDLVISRVKGGRATKHLFNDTLLDGGLSGGLSDGLSDGEQGLTASVTGPYGRLVLPDELPARLMLVATSVGIAPFMPMLKTLESKLAAGALQLVLLLGARDRSEFLYKEVLLDLAGKHHNLALRVCYSREKKAEAPFERTGYVTAQLPSLAPDAARDHCLLCGNPQMVDDFWGELQSLGFRHKQVIREKYEFARPSGKVAMGAGQPPTDAQKKLIAEKLARHGKG